MGISKIEKEEPEAFVIRGKGKLSGVEYIRIDNRFNDLSEEEKRGLLTMFTKWMMSELGKINAKIL